MFEYTESDIARFWKHVDKTDDCWNWTMGKQSGGYGNFVCRKENQFGAHRVSFELAYGPIPDGMFVLHRCDHPSCVRPDHLFLGTQQDNVRDCFKKGRRKKPMPPHYNGSKSNLSKLKEGEVLLIRKLYTAGIKPSVVYKMFRISKDYVHVIVRRKTWAHI